MNNGYSHRRNRGEQANPPSDRPRAQSLQPRSARGKGTAQSRYAATYRNDRAQAALQARMAPAPKPPKPSRLSIDGRLRWEVYFVIGVILALAVIFGIGVFVASEKAKPAFDRSSNPAVATAEAASPAAAITTNPPAENPTTTTPAALENRASDFAVNPNRTHWNFATDGKKTVYLTIDDGPSENTAAVLDILDRYGAKATFFVTGMNEDYFPMISEAYKRGHTIGMHTYSHDYGYVYSSPENYFADLEAISNVVRDQIGYVPCFIRFPGGSSNEVSTGYTEGIMSYLAEEVQNRGYQYWDWNLSVGDGSEHTAKEIVGYGTEPIESENIVLLCHDGVAKQTTVKALPKIIEHYQKLGFAFEALSPESFVCHHDILN